MDSVLLWWKKLGLQLRLQILIQGCLLLALVSAQLWLAKQFEQKTLEAAEERARAVADSAINGLNAMMVTQLDGKLVIKDKSLRALFIEKLGAAEDVREMRIFRDQQLDSEFPPGLPQEQAIDALDRSVLATGKPEFRLTQGKDGAALQRTVLPFIASKNFRTINCLECHSVAEGSVLGAASITIDVTDDLAAIRKANILFWAGQGVLQLILGFSFALVLRRLSKQLGGEPAEVIDIVRRIAKGNLSQQIITETGDSSSLLAAVKQMQAERKQVEDSLEEKRVQLADIVTFLPDATLAIDSDKRVIIWNRAIETMTGIAAAEMLGKGDYTYTLPFYGEARPQLMDLIFLDAEDIAKNYPNISREGNSLTTEVFCNALYGNRGAWVFAKASPLHDHSGKVIGAIEIIRDITESKRQDEKTRQLVLEMETILHHALVGIVYLKHRIIVSCNRGAEEIFGYEHGEMVGKSTEILYDSHNTFLEVGARAYSELGQSNKYTEEVLLKRKDGRVFWGALTGSALDPLHPQEGSIWIYSDISARKQAEIQLQEHQASLEELVSRRTAELSKALKAATQSDKAKDAFLANISHEMRTPLNAVIGMANLAQGLSGDPKQRDYLSKIVKSGKHLNTIINELLDLSKIAAGRMEFEKTSFSLSEMIRHNHSLIVSRAEEKGLALVETIDPAVPDLLQGDPLRIGQIILNLVGNAIKFTKSGRVEVRIGLLARQGNRVCLGIEVEDTGMGMRQEDLARIFEPFSQADSSVTRMFGGTGLGLAISRRLAEMMEGNISVVSHEGKGTTFRVELWLAVGRQEDLADAEAPVEEGLPLRYRDVRVLVVEDQDLNREIVEALLSAVGIVACMAENGQEALDTLTQAAPGTFDLVLMDVQMPVMDGLTATRALRSRPEFAALPVIGMTAHTMEHERKIGAEAGMNDHIGKPFDNASFYRTLARWLPKEKMDASAARAEQAASEPVGEQHSLHGVDVAAAVARFSGKEERYRHWLADFINTAYASCEAIRSEAEVGRLEAAAKLAHALKGRVGMLGMSELHQRVLELEQALRQSDPATGRLAELKAAIEKMCVQLTHYLAQEPPAPADTASARVTWTAACSVGVEELDQQHMKLFGMINKLADCIDAKRAGSEPAEAFIQVLSDMFDYTQAHFSAEEAHMRRIAYPDLERHIAQHQAFVEKVSELSLKATDRDLDMAGTLRFLQDWLSQHILLSDMQYRHFAEAMQARPMSAN